MLNKSDLADEKETQKWINYFKNNRLSAVIVDSNSGKGIENVRSGVYGNMYVILRIIVPKKLSRDQKKLFEQLEERQKLFYEGKFLAPLAMFPEGTTTSGRNILKFKKGTLAYIGFLVLK